MGNIIYGINWALRTFNKNDPESPQDEVVKKAQEPAVPRQQEPKKKAVVIEVMPDKPMPESYADYRPFLQRDGLILWAWEIYNEVGIRIIWVCSNRTMRRYQREIYFNDEEITPELLSTVCPDKKYEIDIRGRNPVPDYIFYAAPVNLNMNTRKAFIAKLKTFDLSVDLDYEYSLGRQRQDEEKAVADKIQNCSFITAEEAELLEEYRQLDANSKLGFLKYIKALLAVQEKRA